MENNNQITDFTHILVKGRKDNTYKFALARFILDEIKFLEPQDLKIPYSKIAESFLKYYWNQIVVYKLKQDFKLKRKPLIVSILEEKTKEITQSYESFFKKKENKLLRLQLIKDIENNCLRDVIPRFQIDHKQNIYQHFAIKKLNKKNKIRFYLPKEDKRYILIPKSSILVLKRSKHLLFYLTILEWAKFLEKTNFTPRLIEKIERLNNPQRKPLTKYKNILLNLEKTPSCFYCGKCLDINEIHIDHFIPWSYIFEDKLWNLVISCDKCNLKKSNFLSTQSYLDKLMGRNIENNLFDSNQVNVKEYYTRCKKEGFMVKSI